MRRCRTKQAKNLLMKILQSQSLGLEAGINADVQEISGGTILFEGKHT